MHSYQVFMHPPSLHVRGRSGKEGLYPQLVEYAEKRLTELDPDRFAAGVLEISVSLLELRL